MASPSSTPIHLAIHAVRLNANNLLQDPNVMGVAVGKKLSGGKDTGDLAVTIFVARKLGRGALPSSALLPSKLLISGNEVPTDIVEASGPFYQHANVSSALPARPGTSIGEVSVTAGTFGAVVYDNKSGAPLILSNSHVLANNNQAPLGSPIVLPAPYDGGVAPSNTIAKLSRFIPLIPQAQGTNTVDAAVASPLDASSIDNTPLNGVPGPGKNNPAVGLLWGGDGVTLSFYSPIDTVLALLDVRFASADSTLAPAIGQQVQKTGRTTEKTTGKITHVNATLRVSIIGIGIALFTNQFITTLMSQGGDSGAVAIAV
ncbi:hypothetical protein [Pyxidicoccus sp. MSG2]|uniref:hypothetical protein n=1 Tax=Pyxidicoccus sp. MSG2 TaxID=2996790 RepID=UPI00226DB60B|nr:hypothetical protein [Pyxidicoccus sp. MSG2]MCY1023782.1 hypothetical protein [Pyxidicoccus sp. MSG2]